MFPMVAKLGDIRSKKEEASRITTSAISIVFVLLLGVVAVITPIGREVVRVLYPQKLILAGDLLPWLLIAMCLLSIMHLGLSMISSSGKATFAMLSFLTFFAIQTSLLFILIPKYGMFGAVVSTLSAAGIGALSVLFFLWHHFSTKYSILLIFKSFLMASIVFAIVYFVQPYLATHSKLWTVLLIAFTYSLYLVGLYFAKILDTSHFQKKGAKG
jgi:O-antigen/teichoic acid export membrane protein